MPSPQAGVTLASLKSSPQNGVGVGSSSTSTSTMTRPSDSSEGEPNAKKRRRSKACLECRALKIACIPSAPNSNICQRCSRFNFECVFTPNKRGRKPKSKLGQLNRTADSALATLAAESEALPRMNSTGMMESVPELSELDGLDDDGENGNMFDSGQDTRSDSDGGDIDEAADTRRGHTWTFLNQPAGKPSDSTEGVSTVEPVLPGGTPSEARKRRKGTFSMRDMLHPVGPVATDYLPEPEVSADMTKRGVSNDDDPVSLGYVSERIARLLVDFYFVHMNSWFGVLDARYDSHDSIRTRSPFLYTAVLAVASLHNQQQIHLPIRQDISVTTDRVFLQPFAHQQISLLAINHATAAFIEGQSSLGVVQAFFLLSTWKSPDDSISYLRTGYAAKLAMDLELSRKEPAKDEPDSEEAAHWWRARQRTWLNLFVQDRVQGCQYFNSYMLPLRDPLIEDCSTWHRHPYALLGDVVLVASVQSRRIQSNFRDQISLILSSTSLNGDCGQRRSRYVMLQLLIESLQSSLLDWYGRWKDELIRVYHVKDDAVKQADLDERLRIMRVWKYAIQVHLCSFALSDSLEDKGEQDPLGGPQKALLALAAFRPVLEGTRGILQEFALLSPIRLRSAPDTMSILPDLAAVCLWKLAQMRGNQLSVGLDYSSITLPLISEVVKVYRSAIVDRTDNVLLHARFLSSVGGRIRQLKPKKSTRRQRRAGSNVNGSQAGASASPPVSTHVPFAKLEQIQGQAPVANTNALDPLLQTMPMYPDFDDIFEGVALDGSMPGVPDTTIPDFDTAFGMDPNIFGNGCADPLGAMSNHPLGAFSFDMDLMSLLNGSFNGSQTHNQSGMTTTAPDISIPTQTPGGTLNTLAQPTQDLNWPFTGM